MAPTGNLPRSPPRATPERRTKLQPVSYIAVDKGDPGKLLKKRRCVEAALQ
jgi:hypothetical protein